MSSEFPDSSILAPLTFPSLYLVVRLWGWAENGPELKRAVEEGPEKWNDVTKSTLEPYLQGVAHRNSMWSQLNFSEWRSRGSREA